MARYRRERGFTLLEMMLVLLLLGIGTWLVIGKLPNSAYRVEQESQRLAERLQRLTYQATLEGRTYGLRVEPGRWQLKRWHAQGWQDVTLPQGAAAQTLPAGWRLELLPPMQETAEGAPQVLMLPGGEVTPFQLRYFLRNG
ncbi:type II secretion system minor pseudopilin GspH [Serratia sp. L9]|uniref:type II secretion system minor pseudopilin GspH n=1 Tax=Serratia sp. L9 TaxID=3423946 RepID=UPI003D673AEE